MLRERPRFIWDPCDLRFVLPYLFYRNSPAKKSGKALGKKSLLWYPLDMTVEDTQELLEDLRSYIEYLEFFVKVAETLADDAQIEGALEVEAPFRAAAHHVNTVLGLFRSAEMDLDPGPRLRVVK